MADTLYPNSIQKPPMKYCSSPSQNKIDEVMISTDWIMQQKYDGAWYQLEKTDNGEVYLFGRTLSKVTNEYTEKIANVPWLKEWAQNLPNGTTLIGEIYIPGGHSNDVTKIMGCLPEKAIERQKNVHVQYMVFDCIRYNGEDLCKKPFFVRFETYLTYMLGDLFAWSNALDNSYQEDEHVKIVNTWTIDGMTGSKCEDGSFQNELSNIFSSGGEGAVFKHVDSIYRPGMRTTSSQSFKMKEHIDSIDLVVMDVLDPEKLYKGKEIKSWPYWMENCESDDEWKPVVDEKIIRLLQNDIFDDGDIYVVHHHSMNFFATTKPYYYGWKNAIKLGAYNESGELLEVGRVASGLTDEDRASLADDSGSFISSVCEISCMSINKKDHTIRHPVFMRFRDDKDAADCKIEEIFS